MTEETEKMSAEVRALTLRQPWASLVACGAKRVETRSWSTKYRGRLLIHAGKAPVPRCPRCGGGGVVAPCSECGLCAGTGELWLTLDLDRPVPFGAVETVTELVDVIPIVDIAEMPPPEPDGLVLVDDFGTLEFWEVGEACCAEGIDWTAAGGHPTWDGDWNADLEDQRPYGDFTPGRYAWLLSDVTPLPTPVPAKGRQGLWKPDGVLLDAVDAMEVGR